MSTEATGPFSLISGFVQVFMVPGASFCLFGIGGTELLLV
jgi:hypothetical protein